MLTRTFSWSDCETEPYERRYKCFRQCISWFCDIYRKIWHILDIDHNPVLLNLSSNSNKSVITVTNNTDVEIQWQGWDRSLITLILKNLRIAGHAEYEVRVHGVEGLLGDKVIISLTNNDLDIEIDMNYQQPEKNIPLSRMEKYLGVCTKIVFVLLAFSVLICFLLSWMQRLYS